MSILYIGSIARIFIIIKTRMSEAEVLADSDYLSLSRCLSFFSIYITDICQTSESFAKSVNLKKERAKRTIPSVETTGVLR